MGKADEWLSVEKVCSLNPKNDCPDRIVHNAVGGLVFGFVGGTLYRVVVEIARNSGVERAASSAITRAPVIAVSCGIVLAVYSSFECLTERLREKRDHTNCYIAGAATGALLGSFSWSSSDSCRCFSGSSGCVVHALGPRRTPSSLALNAIIGALAFGFLDGPIRDEYCVKKK